MTAYPISAAVAAGDQALATQYNNLRLDMLGGGQYVFVYNNDAATINQGDPICLDPSYTSGLGVMMPTSTLDMRVFGVVSDTSIASHASGWIATGNIQLINVTGVVVFGHSLVSSASAHYAQDAGGSGWGPGVIGWALASSGGGITRISAMIKPYPLYYALATTLIRECHGTAITGAGATVGSMQSDGTNRLLLGMGLADVSNKPINFVFNGAGFTALQNGSGGILYFGHKVTPDSTTANVTADYIGSGNSIGAAILLNGVNAGGAVGVLGTGSASSAAASCVVATNPGDLVIAALASRSAFSVSGGRATGQNNINLGTPLDLTNATIERLVVDYAISAGASFTFTWTLSGSVSWNTAGVAIKSV